MGPTSILAILGVLQSILQNTPEAIALFTQVSAMLKNGTEPTDAQWTALDAAMSSHHAALQAA